MRRALGKFLFLTICSFLYVQNLQAEKESDYAKGFWGMFGLGVGGVMVNTSEQNPLGSSAFIVNPGQDESNKKGLTFHGRGGLAWYINSSFVLDFMAGWQRSSVKGSAPKAGLDDVTVKHQTGFFDISPRFRFGRSGKAQLGPLFKMHFGTDTGYEESEGQNFGNEPTTSYIGAHFNYDIPSASRKTLYRIGLQGMMDISDPRTYYRLLGMFEIGFHLFGGSPSYVAKVDEEIEEDDYFVDPVALEEDLPPEPEYVPPPPPTFEAARPSVAEVSGKCTIRFPAVAFNFDTNMSHLKEERSKFYLRELGGWLAENLGIWTSASAQGHTDVRGGDRINVPLSEGRARTFRLHLTEGNVPSDRLSYVGKSSYEPADPNADNQRDPNAWRMNRRTELVFENAQCGLLNSKVGELNSKYGF